MSNNPNPSGANPDNPQRGSGATTFEMGTEWLRGEGEASDVVMSSRARLARNIARCRFGGRSSRADRQHTLETSRNWLLQARLAPRMMWVDLHDAPPLERTLLVERHLISKQHSKGKTHVGSPAAPASEDPRGVAVSLPDERLSVMVNEEDHLRIQVIRSGLALGECWRVIDQVDDRIEAGIDFAFSPRFGYLTACPTNVGTGLRMSVMLHLPALKLTGDIEKVKRAASDMGLAVRGFYGEGSESAGDFYQISNQTTLGKPESRIVGELEQEIIPQVVEYERIARKTLLTKRRLSVEDQIFRALGTLLSARLLATEEAMQLLSHVRLGVMLGLIKDADHRVVNHLMLLVQPAHLQKVAGKELDQEQRRSARAALVRQKLGSK